MEYVIERAEKYLSIDESETSQDEKEATLGKWMAELDYRLPTIAMN